MKTSSLEPGTLNHQSRLQGNVGVADNIYNCHCHILIFLLLVFRLGKCFDQLKVALQTVGLKDPILRFLITFAKINRFFFLLLDHLVWAGRVRLVTIDNKRWSVRSAKFWFIAILFGIFRDIYDFLTAVQIERVRLAHDSTGAHKTIKNAVARAARNNPALLLDFVKNSTDIFLPFSQLNAGAGLSPGLVGVMGVVSSICSLVAIWNESLKLRYS